MPRRFSENYRSPADESGSIIVISTFVIVSLFAVIGFAIDSGNLYRAQIAVQKAADAAAFATVSYMVRQGNDNINTKAGVTTGMTAAAKANKLNQYLQPFAERVALSNMAVANLPHLPSHVVEVTGTYAPIDPAAEPVEAASNIFRYNVTVERPVDFLLMHMLPKWAGGSSTTISAGSSMIRKVVWTVVLLDVSRSMACPSVGPCTCTGPNRTGECAMSGSKFESLLSGLRAFLQTFDLDRDQIILVPYNIRARAFTVAEALQRMDAIRAQNPGIEPYENKVEGVLDYVEAVFRPSSMTNICDALNAGYDRLKALLEEQAVPGNEHIEWVALGDGAPTAGRYFFNDVNPTGGLPQWPPGSGRYDYTFNNIEWVKGNGTSEVGPSLLAQYGAWELQHQDGNTNIAPVEGQSEEPGAVVKCTGGPTEPEPVKNAGQKNAVANSTLGSCLNSLRSHIPGRPEVQFGGDYRKRPGGGPPNTPSMADFAELHYVCAIAMADQARLGPFNSQRGRGRFSVIGIGEPAAATVSPFQVAEDSESRHDVFLARLALDPDQWGLIKTYSDANLDPPEFDYEGYQTFQDVTTADPKLKGQYYPRPNAGELRNLFRTIARKVALRFIQ